jgi:hypothetical protein
MQHRPTYFLQPREEGEAETDFTFFCTERTFPSLIYFEA